MSAVRKFLVLGSAVVAVPTVLLLAEPHSLCACVHPGQDIVGGVDVSVDHARGKVLKRVPIGTRKAELAKLLWPGASKDLYPRYCTEAARIQVKCRFALERQSWLRGKQGYEVHFALSSDDTVSDVRVTRFSE